ncbi:MAG: biopolymer transporter ExbD [Deltaproteobacteria bacterium]|nr:MAG: biopolymer transporter ExbD [Deltaproteobacteria bacterium]
MGMDVGGGKGKVRPSINVTPLVDVVLVLLIIFLVVTPLLTKRFTVLVPPEQEETAPKTESEDQVVLYVDEDGTVTLNSEKVALTALGAKLERVFAARDQDIVFFDASSKCAYGTAMQVMDIARGAGATSVGIITEELSMEEGGSPP